MKYYYDLHIHTALSPCAEDDMTPSNIVNMAILSSLDVIAVTDHNSVKNAAAVMKASQRENGPLVIAGMELTTSEDIHAVVLFPDLEQAEKFNVFVENNRMKIKNKKAVFGNQLYMNELDEIVGEEENLLISATGISIEDLPDLAAKYNAVAFPAHADKPSNGIIAILGGISPETGFHTVEVSASVSERQKQKLIDEGYLVLTDSDSHFLGVMNERGDNYLELEKLDVQNVLDKIRNGKIQNG